MYYLLLFIGLICVLLDAHFGSLPVSCAIFGIDDALLGGLGVLGGSLIGGLFGSSGQKSANAANLQATRETNEQNYKMFQEQLGWTTEMWNKNNQYNTPIAQMKRYQDAGINPYMALDNISGGNADASSTPSPNPAVTPAPMQNTMAPFAASLGNAIPSALAAVSQSLSNREKATNLVYQDARNQAEIKQLNSSGLLSDRQAAYYSAMEKRVGSLMPLEMQQMEKHLGLTDAQINEVSAHAELLKLNAMRQKYDLDYIAPAQLRKVNTEIWSLVEQVKNGRISASAAASQAAASMIGAQAQHLDANTRKRQYDDLRFVMKEEIESRVRLNQWNSSPEANLDVEVNSEGGKVKLPAFGEMQFLPGAKIRGNIRTRQ